LIDKYIEFELKSIFDESCLFSNEKKTLMFFYVNNIVFAFKEIRKRNAKNIIRRMKKMFNIQNFDSLNFFLEIQMIQKLKTI
jgi:hypothetical protein